MAGLNRGLPMAVAAALLGAQLGCGTPPAQTSPRLRLSPASLGTSLALQQQLTTTVRGQTQQLDVLLEADSQSVRVAVINLGQTAARLEWDGTTMTESHAAWWPAAVSGERVLGDLQLMLWPASAVSAALPAGWSLETSRALRVLSQHGQPVIRVQYDSATAAELVNLREGYAIRVESRPLEAAP